MKFLITGGTGFIGHHLIAALIKDGHEFTLISRNPASNQKFPVFTWNQMDLLSPSDFDVVINLAGENIGEKRWSKTVKEKILNSRISATDRLIQWCLKTDKPLHLYSASAIGIYGLQPTQITLPAQLTESTEIPWGHPTDFLSIVAQDWEKSASRAAENPLIQVTFLRFAPVLKKGEGMLKKIMPAFYLGLGGKLGSGNQAFSWIHLEDAIQAILFLIHHPHIIGPVNICAPECVSQKEFAHTLAKSMNRPAIFTTPAFLLKLAFGEMADELLLSGQNTYPERLMNEKFKFIYPTLTAALNAK